MAETILPNEGDILKESNPESMRVRLTEYASRTTEYASRTFVCYTTPDVAESQTVNYKAFDPVHAPASILSYVNTPSRTFSLSNVKLISRTRNEADNTIKQLNLLRSWTKPVFGTGIYDNTLPSDILGAPPKVLKFSAYARDTKMGLIHNVPVVITSLSLNFPSDVDYIPSSDGIPVAVMMSIDISLTETHSPSQIASFNIADYRAGKLVGY